MSQRTQWVVTSLVVVVLVFAATAVSLAQEDQVSRGQTVYNEYCAKCHVAGTAPQLNATNLGRYSTAQGLYNYISAAMPLDAPGSLTGDQYWDVTAHLLNSTGLLPADTELNADSAASIALDAEAAPEVETTAPESAETETATPEPPAAAEPAEAESTEAEPAEEYTIEPIDYATVVGEILWQELQAAEYAENWETLPDRDRLYQGTEPHGVWLSTFLNPIAMEALTGQPGQLPVGATIVKENYNEDQELGGITVMQKQANYGDAYPYWVWASYAPDGSIQASGAVEGCIACHSEARANDYVYTFTVNPEAGN
jgi:hypothetical protein